MANTIRIKRRSSGGAGAPSTLENAELAFNEVDDTLYYGEGTGGAGGTATTVLAIGGSGAFVTRSTSQTVSGDKTFSGVVSLGSSATATTQSAGDNSTSVATTAYVDSAIVTANYSFDVAGDGGTAQTIDDEQTLTIAGGTGLTTTAGATDTITIDLDNTTVTPGSYGSTTAIPTFTVDQQGRLTAAGTASITTSFTLTDGTNSQTIAGGDTLTLTGGTGVSITVGATDTATFAIGQAVGTSDNVTFNTVTADVTGDLTGNVTGNVTGNASTADAWSTARTITLGGDLSGNVSIDGSANVTLAATINANSVALGTDTTGDYVTSLVAGTGVTLSNNSGEGATPTVSIGQAVETTSDVSFNSVTTTAGATVGGDIAVNGGDITTTSTGTVSLFAANANEINIGTTDATAITLGGSSSTTTIGGNLVVNGTTTTISSTTINVDDKNIELGAVNTPTDTTADGGGLTLKGATDKTLNWVDATDAWTSSEHFDIATGKEYYIAGTSVLSGSTLGSGVTSSSLTSVGTISTGTWNGTTIAIAYGGTGATTASDARTNLGVAIGSDVQAYDAGLADISGLSVADGNIIVGNGANWVAESGATARASLGLSIGSDVQAYDADLSAIAGLANTDGNFIVGNGSTWVVESGATARTSLGLGSIAIQAASNVTITGGTIDATAIGGTTAAAGAFTTLTANDAVTLTANDASSSYTTGTLVVTGGVGISGALYGNSSTLSGFDVDGGTF